MHYSVSDTINKPRQSVIDALVDVEKMKRWQQGMLGIESTSGILFQQGSSGYQLYEGVGVIPKLKVSVPYSNLPEAITLVYEIPGVINTCAYRFIEENGATTYQLDVTFEFIDGTQPDEHVFKAGTIAMMKPLKEYVENESLTIHQK